jgi:hypothetical protein
VLFAAAQLPDLIWPILVLTGVERVRIEPGATAYTPLAFEHYPWSHSLVAVVLWAVLAAIAYRAVTRDERGAIAVGALVVSHWVLDFITHRPDLPLYPGGPVAGLGLWNSPLWTMIVEAALFLVGLVLYVNATRARDRIGGWALWGLVILFVVIDVGNAFGPPPPNVTAVAGAALAMWLLVLLAWWADRHREPAAMPTARSWT